MTPQSEGRVRAALAELADALVAAAEEPSAQDAPERLLSIAGAARLAGIGRSLMYAQLANGRVRSVRVGRRRLIPLSAITALGQSPPEGGN